MLLHLRQKLTLRKSTGEREDSGNPREEGTHGVKSSVQAPVFHL